MGETKGLMENGGRFGHDGFAVLPDGISAGGRNCARMAGCGNVRPFSSSPWPERALAAQFGKRALYADARFSNRGGCADSAGNGRADGKRSYSVPGGVQPVSYTHLDVYKRQVL